MFANANKYLQNDRYNPNKRLGKVPGCLKYNTKVLNKPVSETVHSCDIECFKPYFKKELVRFPTYSTSYTGTLNKQSFYSHLGELLQKINTVPISYLFFYFYTNLLTLFSIRNTFVFKLDFGYFLLKISC